ncbi:MAG TPA: histidine ammonia-lyase [Thermoanaerobaculia bacterium]|nr:histidine ammonia-lyase [Thermoanaerobaculia bacterium]
MTIVLDGESLSIEELARIARDPSVRVERDPATDENVAKSEALIAHAVENYKKAWAAGEPAPTEYGVTTGFGEFKDKPIAPDDLEQLQRNLLLSHSVGVGEAFPADVVRAVLATRLNAFLQGHSGVRRTLVDVVQAMLNRGVIPVVPIQGSVGASGDLCPLSHTFATLLGSGQFYTIDDPALRDARELPELLGFDAETIKPTFKEGLALVNGVNFSAAMLALGVYDAERLADVCDEAAALSLEALCGCTRALDAKVHDARGHLGQIRSAAHMRELVEGSHLVERAGAVQDPYSLRCAPQVHGASRHAIDYARGVAEREINAATDNPLFFPGEGEPFDLRFRDNWPANYRGDTRLAYSAGNFHGQPIALAADFLAIALAELANISERRAAMLLDGNHNRGLPQNLTTRPGVNSGLMIAQYTAASLVSENKVLAHPASVDSIPTSANAEDHVSMSTHAARKMRSVLANAQNVVAIELLVAAQAIDWRAGMECDPLAPRRMMSLEEAEQQARDFELATRGRSRDIALRLGRGTREIYLRVRGAVEPVTRDRALSDDVRRLANVIFETRS